MKEAHLKCQRDIRADLGELLNCLYFTKSPPFSLCVCVLRKRIYQERRLMSRVCLRESKCWRKRGSESSDTVVFEVESSTSRWYGVNPDGVSATLGKGKEGSPVIYLQSFLHFYSCFSTDAKRDYANGAQSIRIEEVLVVSREKESARERERLFLAVCSAAESSTISMTLRSSVHHQMAL